MAQESWGELKVLSQNSLSTRKKKQRALKKPQAELDGGDQNIPQNKVHNSKSKNRKTKKKKEVPGDMIEVELFEEETLDDDLEDELEDELEEAAEVKETSENALDTDQKHPKKKAEKKAGRLTTGKGKAKQLGTKAKNKSRTKKVAKEESEEWKKQEKKYKRTKKRTKIIGIMIAIFVIIATLLGYVYYFQIDTDGDGKPDVSDPDDDNDEIPDFWEKDYGLDPKDSGDAYKDKDKDGLKNYFEYKTGSNPLVKDTDSDGLLDGEEWKIGTNPNDPDTDHDRMPDGWEVKYNLNPKVYDADSDNDQDGYDRNLDGTLEKNEYYTNLDEYINGTDPISKDTDSDGMWDGWENRFYLNPNDPSDAGLDTDDDGLLNLEEFQNKTNPTKPDTDGDNLKDYEEIIKYKTDPLNWDTDGDGLWDGWEIYYGGTSVGLNPNSKDTDGDKISDDFEDLDDDDLNNKIEHLPTIGTSPVLWDTDGDGMPDGWEVVNSCLDPRISNAMQDIDLDLISNLAEFENGTDPCEQDTDGDGLTDTQELVTGFHGFMIDGKYIVNSSMPLYFTNATRFDTDGDNLNDSDEVLVYKTNASNVDTDGDGITDDEEIISGEDGFVTNPANVDTDNDRLNDWLEIFSWGTKPTIADTDGDGLLDGEEVLVDYKPFSSGLDTTDPKNPDTDGDGMTDGWEGHHGFASRDLKLPNKNKTVIESYDQRYETNNFLQLKKNSSIAGVWLVNPLRYEDRDEDADYDGYDNNDDGKIDRFEEYNNSEEFEKQTYPVDWDTDDDGMSDGWEWNYYGYSTILKVYGPDPRVQDGDLDNDDDGVYYYVDNIKYKDDFDNLDEYSMTGKDLNGDGIIDHGTTDPNDPSTNNNPFSNDYEEIWYGDDDNDGLDNGWELLFNDDILDPGDYQPKFYPDFEDYKNKFNPKNNDSDGNGIEDGDEDYDGDTHTNRQEQGSYLSSPGSSDPTDPEMTPFSILTRSEPGTRAGRKANDETQQNQNHDHLYYNLNLQCNIHTENIYVISQIIDYCDKIKSCIQLIQTNPLLAFNFGPCVYVCSGDARW